MRAAVIEGYGGVDRLQVREMADPSPGPGQLLVRVMAAGMNPLDAKVRQGSMRFIQPVKFPWVPGYELAGVVAAVGPEVSGFVPGDAVHGNVKGGACAGLALLDESAAAPKPERLSFAEAAAVPVAALTAWQGLLGRGELAAGERVLINGGAGGVGHFAVQIAAALGAHVTAVASGRHQDFLRELGAERTLDYGRDDFTRDEETFDVVFDVAATSDFTACDLILGEGGVYVTTLPGPAVFFRAALTAVAGLFGKARRARWVILRPRAADLVNVDRLIEQGRVRPVVDRVFPLDEIRAAHQAIESGHARGKMVVKIG